MEKSKPSKSAKKREFLELQELGEQLILLTDEQLDRLLHDSNLRDAVVVAKSINSHGALRRQKQLIGKLMRDVDPAPIREGLAMASQDDRQAKSLFKVAENWRDRLIVDGNDAVADYCAETGASAKTVNGLIYEYRSCNDEASRKRIRRRIFRQVHDQLHKVVQKDMD